VAGSLPAALLPATKRVTTSNNRFATQRDRYRDTSSQTSPGHDARTTTNAGLDPRASTVSQIAISASRDVVDLLAVVNVGQDYRDLLNAGNALLRPAKFESASQSAERVRPPMRGRRVSELSLADVAHPDGPEMHEFRAKQGARRRVSRYPWGNGCRAGVVRADRRGAARLTRKESRARGRKGDQADTSREATSEARLSGCPALPAPRRWRPLAESLLIPAGVGARLPREGGEVYSERGAPTGIKVGLVELASNVNVASSPEGKRAVGDAPSPRFVGGRCR